MLEKFEVYNFMGFKDNLVFDFHTSKKYTYNTDLVQKSIIKKALVFGENSSGKSNLCYALMDIIFHLSDKEKISLPESVYLCANGDSTNAIFKYHFKFNGKSVLYEYSKKSANELCYEKLYYRDELILEYNYFDISHTVIKIPGAEQLNKVRLPEQLSMLKYIYSNTIQDEKSIVRQVVDFVNGMLYFKSLRDGNMYMGYSNGSDNLSNLIIKKDKLEDFQIFLSEMGVNYNLEEITTSSGDKIIGVKFKNKVIEFNKVASSGTKTLWLLYCWLLEFENLKFLVIDEFDAYYHFNLSKNVLQRINQFTNLQAVITTHTTFLMQQETTRPDCCFILKDSAMIKPICKLTKKEIRDTNNIEKMYREGQFVDW